MEVQCILINQINNYIKNNCQVCQGCKTTLKNKKTTKVIFLKRHKLLRQLKAAK